MYNTKTVEKSWNVVEKQQQRQSERPANGMTWLRKVSKYCSEKAM